MLRTAASMAWIVVALATTALAKESTPALHQLCATNNTIRGAKRFPLLNQTAFVTCLHDRAWSSSECPSGFVFVEDQQGCAPYVCWRCEDNKPQ